MVHFWIAVQQAAFLQAATPGLSGVVSALPGLSVIMIFPYQHRSRGVLIIGTCWFVGVCIGLNGFLFVNMGNLYANGTKDIRHYIESGIQEICVLASI